MPPALTRVEEASVLLIEASDMLRADPFSAAARKKLIEGSRGISYCYVMRVDCKLARHTAVTYRIVTPLSA